MNDNPTHKAVIAEAERLCTRAAALTNPASQAYDPWAKPYAPSKEAAYKLCQRIANRLERDLKATKPTATAAEIAKERAKAPRLAIQEMQMRASERTAAHRADMEADRRRRERLSRIQRNARDGREAAVSGLSPGQRIDRAIAQLSVVAAPAASTVEAPVTGSREQPPPPFTIDPADKARERAVELARKLENDLDAAKRRRVELEAA